MDVLLKQVSCSNLKDLFKKQILDYAHTKFPHLVYFMFTLQVRLAVDKTDGILSQKQTNKPHSNFII